MRRSVGSRWTIYAGLLLFLLAMLSPLVWWSSWPQAPRIGKALQPASTAVAAKPDRAVPEVWLTSGEPRRDGVDAAWEEWLELESLGAPPRTVPPAPTVARTSVAAQASPSSQLKNVNAARVSLEVERRPSLDLGPGRPRRQDWMAAAIPSAMAPSHSVAVRSEAAPIAQFHWPLASSLLEDLKLLEDVSDADAQVWRERVAALVRRLASTEEPQPILQELEALCAAARVHQERLPHSTLRCNWARVAYSLRRRLAVWAPAALIASRTALVSLSPASDEAERELKVSVARARQLLEQRGAAQWIDYLMLDTFVSRQSVTDLTSRAALANRLERRLFSEKLSDRHRRFLAAEEFRDLHASVWRWASAGDWDPELLEQLEAYEHGLGQSAAEHVASVARALRWSGEPAAARLGAAVETHFRNANLRVSLSDRLLNRAIEDPAPVRQPIRDHVMGADVGGQSLIVTGLKVGLVPDPEQWRLNLQAVGKVDSRTRAVRGSVQVVTDGWTEFAAEKPLRVTPAGLFSETAYGAAATRTSLRGLSTDYDNVPLIGWVVRSVARRKYDENLTQAEQRAERRVASEVESRLDQEVEKQTTGAQQRLEEAVFAPLRRLKISPEATEMRTLSDRLIARGRMAGAGQLSAHTPRPLAPSDCWASLQVHQSALNNSLQGLNLAGRRGDLREVMTDVARQLGRDNWTPPADVPHDVLIEMAAHDPVRALVQDGAVQLAFRVTELDAGGQNFWYDFEILATYQPVIDGLQLGLVREDGALSIDGEELGFRDRLALRAIFSKVFAARRVLAIVNAERASDRRLAGLRIVQCDLRDGWVSVAVGDAPAASTASESKPRAR